MMTHPGAALADLARFVLPNCCVACGRAVEIDPDELVCGVCRLRLRPVGIGCQRCAQPMPPVGPCRFCTNWAPDLVLVRSAVWLTDEAREVAHHLKYDDYPGIADFAARTMEKLIPRPAGACLMPIPLGHRRLRSRGYNQAGAIARALGARWRLPVREDVLGKTRDTVSQTSLTPEARLVNVAGAFAARSTRNAGAGAILVDDVLTTGATLHEAAVALAGAGWKPVAAVTFTRAQPFEVRAQLQGPVSTR